VIGLLRPYLSRIGLGRLPPISSSSGQCDAFYFLIVTCFAVERCAQAVFWAINR
jgi:hypothetical protein